VVAVAPGSPAAVAGLEVGDELLSVDGQAPRDVIAYRFLTDGQDPVLTLRRGRDLLEVGIEKPAGVPLGVEVSSPVFDRVRTCDNHCAFCFIYQLPKGLRQSLYVKDDDYRLSFLYGNFTTLTRFTELDLERVVEERLSPLHVSIHATDPEVRARLLRNPRGATSLRWLRCLLDAGIEVHGQIVVCPGINDGPVLEATLADLLDGYAELASVACVPLGLSRHSAEPGLRPHRPEEAVAVLETVGAWQELAMGALGRRFVFAADEYYLMAGRPFPDPGAYEGFPQHENGVGMAAAFAEAFAGRAPAPPRPSGFFQSVDGAPPAGYRAVRVPSPRRRAGSERPASGAAGRPVTILTGELGAQVLGPLLAGSGWLAPAGPVEVLAVPNRFFGGTVGVTGLLTGADLAPVLATVPAERRVLLPDVCLSEGRFLDGSRLEDLGRPVEVVPADGAALLAVLQARGPAAGESVLAARGEEASWAS
jgi:putative radical SAM enzyme (TIGR03279 family)